MTTTNSYLRGQKAYSDGLYPKDNPYGPTMNPGNRKEWLRGWKDALINDPLMDQDEKQELMKRVRES